MEMINKFERLINYLMAIGVMILAPSIFFYAIYEAILNPSYNYLLDFIDNFYSNHTILFYIIALGTGIGIREIIDYIIRRVKAKIAFNKKANRTQEEIDAEIDEQKQKEYNKRQEIIKERQRKERIEDAKTKSILID